MNHIVALFGPWETVACAARKRVALSPVKLWIVDIGAANDIVAESEIAGLTLKKAGIPMIFDTANGEVNAYRVCPMKLRLIGQVMAP